MNGARDPRRGRPGGSGPPGPRHRSPARGDARGEGRGGAREDGRVVLYGWHPVSEALRNPARRARRLLCTENAALRLAELGTLPLDPEIVRPDAINALVEPDAVHQGLYLEADALPSPALEDLPDDALVLALDQITDPHNVGAIVRSAAAFGVAAIVTTNRHSPAATGVLAKAASGGLEHVPLVVVRNLGEALERLGARAFARVGLDSEAPTPLGAIEAPGGIVVVLGAEGKGLRQRTRSLCDVLARLPLPGAIRSLNVSNAAAIALYAVTNRRAAAP